MSSSFNIEIDQAELRGIRFVLSGIRNGYPDAVRWSLNRTVSSTKTAMSAEARKILNLRKATVDKKIEVRKATKKDIRAYVRRAGKPVSLTSFIGTRQVKTGVSAKVLKTGNRKVLKHAFIATANKAEQAFWRNKPKYRVPVRQLPKNWPAYFASLPDSDPRVKPIERLTGPRVEDILSRPAVIKIIQAKAAIEWDKNIAQQTKYLLGKFA